jgi:hypothetical protein
MHTDEIVEMLSRTLINPRSRDLSRILDNGSREGHSIYEAQIRSRITEEHQDAERHCCKLNDRSHEG